MRTVAPNKIFFERAGVKITATRFDIGLESFQVRKISGVRMESGKRHTRVGAALLLAGLVALCGGMFTSIPVLIVSGAAFTVGGTMLCLARVDCSLVITTRSRDVKVMTSKDAALLASVASALREAMENRG